MKQAALTCILQSTLRKVTRKLGKRSSFSNAHCRIVVVDANLYCIELEFYRRKNLWRIVTSLVIPSTFPDDALRYLRTYYPKALGKAQVHRTYRVKHVVVKWPLWTCEFIEV